MLWGAIGYNGIVSYFRRTYNLDHTLTVQEITLVILSSDCMIFIAAVYIILINTNTGSLECNTIILKTQRKNIYLVFDQRGAKKMLLLTGKMKIHVTEAKEFDLHII